MTHDIIYTDQAGATLYPSSQVDSTLPNYITENYKKFVTFMERANEAQERLGFGQNLLQNLQRFRNFDTYADGIIIEGELNENLSIDETESLELVDTLGFPSENGIVLINDEVIYYTQRLGNKLLNLERGCSAQTTLSTFTSVGVYTESVPAAHLKGAKVKNVSVLFLASMAQTISDSFSNNIAYNRLNPELDKSILMQNLKDFYQSKGTKLGIKTLFKMFFAENDVDVTYPGDRMIIPSRSGYVERQILRTLPVSEYFYPDLSLVSNPMGTIGAKLSLKSYLTGDQEYAETQVNYVSSYPYEDEVQYEIYVNEDFLHGDFISNPQSKLTRNLNDLGSEFTDLRDIFTITVESTLGFPDKGILFVNNEGIEYTSKSMNQFFGCKRGTYGVMTQHLKGSMVMGPYYVEAKYDHEGTEYISRSWPLGLVESVDIKDPGNLHQLTDEVYINGPGRIDPRDKILGSFLENHDDELATQAVAPPEIGYIGNFTAGVSGQFFDDKYVFVTSSNLPYDTVGPFDVSDDKGLDVGPNLEGDNAIHIIPRMDSIYNPNPFQDKGTSAIGVFADGVSAWSNVSENKIVQGIIAQVVVKEVGNNYITPTLVIDDNPVPDTTFSIGPNGDIVTITTTTQVEYTGDKTENTRVSSGEDGVISLTFDNYGRLTGATIENAGRFYHDTPTLELVDPTGVGRGALLSCTVDKTLGTITSVTILNAGIDYNKTATYVNIEPRGSGCTASAVVQFYTFNRVNTIQNNRDLEFDQNNGFVFKDEQGENTQYAYVVSPSKVRERLGEGAQKHSPIIGWAYDGHPIYGTTIFKNGKDDSGGFVDARSGYFLLPNRQNIIPGGGDEIGTNPPSVDTFPMGTFIQDYVFDPLRVSSSYIISTNNDGSDPNYTIPAGSDLETDPDNYNINAFLGEEGADFKVLTKYNGIIGNTPEYPVELYPDGVFFYVATIEGNTPRFPYIIGDNFYSRPISQNLRALDEISPTGDGHMSYTPSPSFENTVIEFDFNKVDRFRNRYLESTKAGLKCTISAVTEGNLDSCVVINGNPSTSEIGDYIYFDDAGTGGGGATANVSFIEGKNVVRGFGTVNGTTLISHRQEIDLDYFTKDPDSGLMYKPQYVFVADTFINTTSGSTAQVESYNYQTRTLIVQTDTQRLIQPGDVFYDNNHLVAVVRDSGMGNFMGTIDLNFNPPPGPNAGEFWINISNAVPNEQFVLGTDVIPAGTPILYDGTKWIAKTQLNTVYDGTNLMSHEVSSWVQAYKAMLQYEDNKQVILDSGNFLLELDHEAPAIISGRPLYGANLHISATEPEEGVAKQGDMWWSINNGRLFVYYEYVTLDPTQNTYFVRKQWVSAQPFGTRTLAGAEDVGVIDITGPVPDSTSHEMIDNTITISTVAPSSRPDGLPNQLGDLWWSNVTGLLYIWNTNYVFQLEAGELIQSEWVVTDPSASVPDQYASDVTDPTQLNNTVGVNPENYTTDLANTSYTTSVTTIVSPEAPATNPDGTDIVEGTLWWSPLTGRMYIYYSDIDGFQWAVTNPIGTVPTSYALDKPIEGNGGIADSSVRQLPELATTSLLWFNNLRYFRVGDSIKFEVAAPGTENSADTAVIKEMLPGNAAIVNRDTTPIVLPNGCPVIDTTRSLYTINTLTPCQLRPGDQVIVDGAEAPDGLHTILEIGDVTAPVGVVQIEEDQSVPDYGQVLNLDLLSFGSGYESDFYIYFYGGGGTGALALANTSPILGDGTGGNVLPPVKIINPGFNYTSTPTPVYGSGLDTRQFRFFTDRVYPISDNVTYSSNAPQLVGKIAAVDLVSGGGGYSKLPKILGTYPKEIDRAITEITLSGSQIASVDVVYGGSRYQDPIAVFRDGANRGHGAAATVNVQDGIIQSITVTDPGNDYSDPYLEIVNAGGKFITTGANIGNIRSIQVNDPGRNISPDRTLKPELQIACRAIVSFAAQTNTTNFVIGEPVYQGIPSDKLFTAKVASWDSDRQILTMDFNPGVGTSVEYGGVLKAGENIIGEQSGAIALVIQEGQSDTPVVVNGVSGPDGIFINDESMLSKKYAVIQDSEYFQLFSYVISSPKQRKDYEVFVRDIVHPTGFVMFSDVIINDACQSGSFVVNELPVTTQ